MKPSIAIMTAAVLIMLSLLCTSCSSTAYRRITSADELTPQEKAQLVQMARRFITQTDKFLDAQEKIIVQTTAPQLGESYTDYKKGKFAVIWELAQKRIVVQAQGNLLEANRQWEVRVTRYTQYSSDRKLTGTNADWQDFAELMPPMKNPPKAPTASPAAK